ncbi:MAG TPA: hydrogenase iron-sulfur subunit [Deltaproteobacteria bacterium]|nr:hydrogenase iron-sulfur subunit [Deltaproteobacteria bacterium]
MHGFEPKIIVFLCNWCSYEGADAAGRSRKEFPSHNLREIRVMCSGRVDPRFVLEAFRIGADGVLILGCAPGDCHYSRGNIEALKRIPLLERVLQQYVIENERMKFDSVSAGDGEKFARIATEMVEMLKELGPLNHAC